MRATLERLLPVLLALELGLPACGKKGDPQPPLRRAPQGLSAFSVAQRGERVVVSLTAPSAYTDGSQLPVLDVELLRADTAGEFAKLARPRRLRAAPGESRTESEPLPPSGTPLRYAARVLAKGKASALTGVVSLTVRPPPPKPMGLSARRSASGVTLDWSPPAPGPEGSAPAAAPTPVSAAPEAVASISRSPSPEAPATPASATALAGAVPSPTASPAPPTSGFWVYRRTATGSYSNSLRAAPLAAPPFEDARAEAETVCYVVRTVVSTDPVIESADSNEVCLPPAMPAPSPGAAGR